MQGFWFLIISCNFREFQGHIFFTHFSLRLLVKPEQRHTTNINIKANIKHKSQTSVFSTRFCVFTRFQHVFLIRVVEAVAINGWQTSLLLTHEKYLFYYKQDLYFKFLDLNLYFSLRISAVDCNRAIGTTAAAWSQIFIWKNKNARIF